METDARYTLVGSAIIVLLCAVAAAAVWLISAGNGKELRNFRVYFANQTLEGLEIKSEVRMKGIRVGGVTGFEFSDAKPGTVQVDIAIDAAAPVLQSTRAVVDRNLVTGLATIKLANRTENSQPLSQPPGEEIAVIPEGESQLQQVSQTFDQLTAKAAETMNRVNAVLSPENLAAVAETLQNLKATSAAATVALKRADGTLVAVTQMADGLRQSSGVAFGDFHRLADRYDKLGVETSVLIGQTTQQVQRVSDQVYLLSGRANSLLSDADVDLRMTSQELQSMASSIKGASQSYSNPRGIFFGPSDSDLGPGEKR